MRKIYVPLLPWLLAVTLPCWGADLPPPEEPEALLAGVNQAMNPTPAEYFLKLTNKAPNKDPDEYVIYAINQGNKWASVITVPDNLKGRTALRLDNQFWYHVPGELVPRTGQLNQSPVNGTLDYRILFRIDDLPYYDLKILESSNDLATLALTPKDAKGDLPYRTMVIDKKLHIPQTETVFSVSMRPLKEITYLDVRQFGHLPPRPATIVVKSPMNREYSTTMTIGWMQSRDIPAEAFTLPFLPKVGILLKNTED